MYFSRKCHLVKKVSPNLGDQPPESKNFSHATTHNRGHAVEGFIFRSPRQRRTDLLAAFRFGLVVRVCALQGRARRLGARAFAVPLRENREPDRLGALPAHVGCPGKAPIGIRIHAYRFIRGLDFSVSWSTCTMANKGGREAPRRKNWPAVLISSQGAQKMKSIHQRDRRLSVSTLSAAIWLALYGAPVAAQTSPAPESIQVTGTRVTRAEAETALPVTIYTKEDIRATGQATIAEVLRTLTFNTQGSSTPVVASTGQGVTDVNLRGLGFGRTLVLVNGRRVPTDSNFFGFFVSTQFISLGAIERIEILREGASAIYGSDALGGGVNIILSDRYDGVSANFAYTRPTGGGGSAQIYGVTAGFGADRTSAIIAVEHRHTDAVRKADRDVLRSDFSNLGFGFLSNSFPPTYRARDFFGNGSNIAGPLAAAPGCDPALVRTTGPLTLTNAGQSITTGPQTECRNPVANKSDFAPEFDVNSIYGKGRWAFTNELSVFLEGMYVRQDSTGSSNPVTTTLTLAATNPNNPTRNASATSPIAGVTRPRSVSAD